MCFLLCVSVLLQEFGFTREQSSNALIIHGTVKKALEVLSKLNDRPGEFLTPRSCGNKSFVLVAHLCIIHREYHLYIRLKLTKCV